MSVATLTELWRLSATELAEAIRARHVSSRDVVEAHLRRIDEVNPAINAVTVVLRERALEAAEVADRASPVDAISHRCLVCPSPSRRTSTWSAVRRRSA